MLFFSEESFMTAGRYARKTSSAVFGGFYGVAETLFLFLTYYLFLKFFVFDTTEKEDSISWDDVLSIGLSLSFYLLARTRTAYQTIESATTYFGSEMYSLGRKYFPRLPELPPGSKDPTTRLRKCWNGVDTLIFRVGVGGMASLEAVVGNFAASAEKLKDLNFPLFVSLGAPGIFAVLSAPSQFFLLAGNLTKTNPESEFNILSCCRPKKTDENRYILVGQPEERKNFKKIIMQAVLYLTVWGSAFAYSSGNTLMYWNRLWDLLENDLEEPFETYQTMQTIMHSLVGILGVLPLFLGTAIAYGRIGEKFCGLLPSNKLEKVKEVLAYLTAPSSISLKSAAIGIGLFHLCNDTDKGDFSWTVSLIVAILGGAMSIPYQVAFYTKPVERDRSVVAETPATSTVPMYTGL
ncbi:MAG: hypothetical protein JSS53_00700 [Proteobacteria bacterium]|nr:hypothetical protein [Pseudomonadota bacterium]